MSSSLVIVASSFLSKSLGFAARKPRFSCVIQRAWRVSGGGGGSKWFIPWGWPTGSVGGEGWGAKELPRYCPRCDPASRDAFRGHLDPQDTGAGASRRVTAAQRSSTRSTRRKRRRWRDKRRMGGFGCVSSAAFAIPKPGEPREPREPFTRSIFFSFFSPSPPLFPPRARMKCGVTRGRAPLT